jgi:hypothetical protein
MKQLIIVESPPKDKSTITRQRLIDDGYLVDLTRYNQKPLACTFSVFELITTLDPNQGLKIDLVKIVHYVLLMSETCFKTIDRITREFTLILNRKIHTLRLITDENGVTITRDFLELL